MKGSKTMDLTEFLLARIAEDEAEPRAQLAEVDAFKARVITARERAGADADPTTYVDLDAFAHPAYPVRARAECEAKRKIVELHKLGHECPRDDDSGLAGWFEAEDEPCATLRALASVWADHPDYQQEWA